MRTLATVPVPLLLLALAGCAGPALYSKVEFHPRVVPAKTLDRLLVENGPPDLQGQVGDLTLVGWKRSEGTTVLPLFAKGSKPSSVALVDKERKVIAFSRGRPGSFVSILSVFPSPVFACETKR